MTFLRSKLTLVVLSAILIGGAGAVLAGMSVIRPPSFSAALAANNSTGATNTTGAAATTTTAGHSAGSTPGSTRGGTPAATATGPGATPTNTPVPPTPRPTPTATPPPVNGQTLTVRGDVTSISTSTSTFVVRAFGGGGTYTIYVSTSTVWPNPQVPDLQHLQVGMQVDAQGTYVSGGNLNPTTSVDADS